MADQATTIDIKENGILLTPPARYKGEYPRLNQIAFTNHRSIDEWIEFNALIEARKPVYIQYVDPGSKRYGSIARVKAWNSPYRPSYRVDPTKTASRYLESHWDGRRKTDIITNSGEFVTWLRDYNGPTVWEWDRTRKQTIVKDVKDRIGRDIEVGSFCAYILYHFDSQGAAGIYFGKVTKIDKDGTVWFKNIKLKEDDKVDEKRVKDNSNIVIMTKDLMEQLMLARLSVL